jgi:hypothetical protein
MDSAAPVGRPDSAAIGRRTHQKQHAVFNRQTEPRMNEPTASWIDSSWRPFVPETRHRRLSDAE